MGDVHLVAYPMSGIREVYFQVPVPHGERYNPKHAAVHSTLETVEGQDLLKSKHVCSQKGATAQ